MANNSPSIVIASLSDDQLKKSINSLVAHVDEAMKKMVQSTNNAVGEMEAKLKSLGNLKIGSGGTNDGGVSKHTKAQNADTEAIEKNIAAQDRQIKKNQEAEMSFDRKANAQQVAIRSANPSGIRNAEELQTMNIQLDLLRERLREARQQYSSFVALAAHATTTGDKGLFQFATEGVHRYEQEVRNLIPQIRTLQSGIQQMGDVIAPQGHTIQNFVNSLQKANPELAALNAQYKSGTSLLQNQSISYASATQSAQHYTEGIQKQAQAQQQSTQAAKEYSEQVKQIAAEIRQSAQWQKEDNFGFKRGMVNLDGRAYPVAENLEMGFRLEDQIVAVLQRANEERQKGVQITQQQAQASHQLSEEDRKAAAQLGWIEEKRARRRYISPSVEGVSQIRAALQSITGQQEKWVDDIDKTKASYNQLSQYLKELKAIYADIWRDPKNSNAAKLIAQEIQTVQQAMQNWQQTMSRPVSLKDALSGSEKTLDDIAYKMRQLQSYRSGLNVDTQTREIQQVNAEYNRLKTRMDEVMQKNQQMIASNTALGRSWNYMKNRLAFYVTVGASTQFVKNLIEVRSQYELNERALGILIGSAERGTQVFNELSQMSLVSPYTLIELSSAAKQLTAYDIAANDVVDTTRRLADMASAVGVPIERLTYALGQIKAYGYLNSRDQRMFANAGIPLAGELAKYYTEIEGRLVSTGDVYDRIKKKAVDYNDVMQVVYQMTDRGGKFFNFQAKMADTLKVQLANLTLAWNNMLNDIGEETQGVLTTGIGSLKQLFLHWKDLEHIIGEVVIALGAYKGYQLIVTRLMGTTERSLDAQVLAQKRNSVAMLERDALVRKLTIDELRQIATQRQVTAADYQNALSGKALTKSKAMLLVALNKNNVRLKAALVNMRVLTAAEVKNITVGKALSIVFRSMALSIKGAALAMKSFLVSNWALIALGVIYELYHAWDNYNEHVAEINKAAAEHAKEAYENVKEYLNSSVIADARQRNKQGTLGSEESLGVWSDIREKIELSSSASDIFIGKLLQIQDVNERIAQGFNYLSDIEKVAGIIQNMDEDTIKVSSTTWGGILGEGLKDDLEDYTESIGAVIAAYGDMGKAAEELKKQQEVADVGIGNLLYDMQEFGKEIRKTVSSIYDFADSKDLNTNQQREFFERIINETAQAEELSAKNVRILRMKAEEEYYDYAKTKLQAHLDFQVKAGNSSAIERVKNEIIALDEQFGKQETMQQSFFAWLAETQASEVRERLQNKTQQEIEQGEWLTAENLKWIEEITRYFANEYGVSFDNLYKLVKNASAWSIHIPVLFDFIGQTPSDIARDYEARTKKKLAENPTIKDAKSQVDIIKKLQEEQATLANTMETARKAGGKYYEDNKKQWEERNNALVSDIHAYNALTKAEEQAQKQANKKSAPKKSSSAATRAQREAESELAKALSNEIQLINEAKSEYKKLEDAGYETFSALEIIQKRFSQSVKNINAVLAKNNIPLFDLSRFTGASNPRFLLNMLEEQIKALKNNPRVKAGETQKFEIEFSKVDINAKAYDYKKIKEGLDNNLSRLTDEYELAVSLDSDPELGGIFADWMGIDTSVLPRTVEEYASRATELLNKYLKEKGADIELPNLNLTKDDLKAFEEGVETARYNKEWVDAIKNAYEKVQSFRKKDAEETMKGWNSLLEKYSDYQHRLVLVQKNASQERLSLIKKFGSEDEKSQGIRLLDAIKVANSPEEVAKLVDQLKDLANKVSQNDETAIKLNVAIDQKALEEYSKITFEEFQKTPQWMMATGDLASMTDNMIKMLIQDLEKYKRVNKKALNTKDLRKLQKTLNSLHRQARRGNPFHAIADAMDEAKERASEYDDKISETEKKLAEYGKLGRELTEEEVQEVKRLREEYARLKQERDEASKPNAEKIVDSIKEAIGVAQEAIGMFSQMAEAIGGKGMTDAAQNLNKVVNILQMAASGAAIGANFGAEGAAIGAVAGGIMGAVTQFADEISGNAKINRAIKRSELAVKRLELAYVDLEEAENRAYGTSVVGAKQAVRANKELQLAELRRQLVLEQSRKKKNRDEGRILELKQQIKELQYEIKNASIDIINELFGQQSAGDFAEQLVSNMIDAFRQGEDYMKTFYESFDEMVDNMIMKSITSRVVADYIDAVWEDMEDRITKRSDDEAKAYADAQLDVSNYEAFTDKDAANKRREVFEDFWNSLTKEQMEAYYKQYYKGGKIPVEDLSIMSIPFMAAQALPELYQKVWDDYTNNLYATEKSTKKALDKATAITDYDINYIMDKFSETLPELGEQLKTLIGQYYNIGDKSEKQLSSLQQGLQGVSEETASAVEAYLNGMSQQAYLRNDLLTQIRDAVVTMDVDVQTGVQAQMLLQLQQSYAVQMAIQGILEGWNNPSGQAVRVELVS